MLSCRIKQTKMEEIFCVLTAKAREGFGKSNVYYDLLIKLNDRGYGG